MKFGGKQTIADKSKMVSDRYGKTMGAAKGKAPAPKAKVTVTPKGSLEKPGVKIKWSKKF